MNLRIAVGALNQTPLDWDANLERIRDAIRRARDLDARLLCLPELCITGYGCEDAFHAPGVWTTALELLRDLQPDTRDLAVSVGLPLYVRGSVFNAVALLVDGDLRGFVAKQSLAGDGIHYEPRWFKPWPRDVRDDIDVDGRRVPVGDLVFDLGGVRLGFEICEDAWTHDRPGRGHAEQSVDVIFNPSASHFAFGKTAVRERFIIEGARAFGCVYAYSNLLGNEAGRILYDGDTRIASHEGVIARGPRFGFEPVVVTAADVDLLEVRSDRARRDTYRPTLTRGANEIDLDWTPAPPTTELERTEPVDWTSQEEEFTRAVTLGLRDYMAKSRSRGFVVSLSGGADSSAVVALVATMVDLGARHLGLERFASGLGVEPPPASNRDLVHAILTTAYQSTKQSSDTTRDAARTLAEAVGAAHHEIDVDDIVEAYTTRIEDAIGRRLDWTTDDLALQNIQARVRAPSVWLLANIERKLLVSTSNRSEAAVGYATMDGDTAGGLAPIAGIDKAFLRQWLRWMQTTGPEGGAPIPALEVVNDLTPTAELRPASHTQTDEDDLMPYPVLEAIEEAAIGHKRSPARILRDLRRDFDAPDEDLRTWIERFFTLWSRNQWKRERYAPAFHVDDRNLDPKTWCRFPILSGGFRRELNDLKDD